MSPNVLVTGASSGLGLSHAIYLTSCGYNVFGTSRKAENLDLEALKTLYLTDHTQFRYTDKEKTIVRVGKHLLPQNIIENLDEFIEQIQFITMDVSDENTVNQAVDEIESEMSIDILVNNAGIGYFGPIEELPMESVKHQFEVNVFGLIRVINAVLPRMRERRKGKIINTASMAGLVCIPFQAHYSASKAAILRLTESLRLEVKPFNIRVCSISPGDINTLFNANTAVLHQQDKDFISNDIQEMKSALPIPEESCYWELPIAEESCYWDQGRIAWKKIIENLIVSPPPIVISKKVEKIIRTKNPKVHYLAGPRLQTWGVPLLKRLLPDSWTTRIVAMFYGL